MARGAGPQRAGASRWVGSRPAPRPGSRVVRACIAGRGGRVCRPLQFRPWSYRSRQGFLLLDGAFALPSGRCLLPGAEPALQSLSGSALLPPLQSGGFPLPGLAEAHLPGNPASLGPRGAAFTKAEIVLLKRSWKLSAWGPPPPTPKQYRTGLRVRRRRFGDKHAFLNISTCSCHHFFQVLLLSYKIHIP